jgi:hypothetical protein
MPLQDSYEKYLGPKDAGTQGEAQTETSNHPCLIDPQYFEKNSIDFPIIVYHIFPHNTWPVNISI